MYPRNFIAPDGRVFGYDSAGRMYYVNTSGTGAVTTAGQFSGPTGSDSSAAMFRPGRILQFGGNSSERARHRHQRRRARGDADAAGLDAASPRHRDDAGRRPGARDRRQPRLERDDRRQQQRRDLEPDHRTVDSVGAVGRARAPVPLDGRAAAGRERAGRRRRRAGPADQHQHRGLLPVLPLQRRRRLRGAAGDRRTRRGRSTSARRSTSRWAAAGAVSRVVMVKTSSVTHSWNMEQRFVELTFQQDGSRLRVQAPARAADAPPGFYMLFVLNAAGTPVSRADPARRRRRESQPGDHAEPRSTRAIRRATRARRRASRSPPPTRTATRSPTARAACRRGSPSTRRPA